MKRFWDSLNMILNITVEHKSNHDNMCIHTSLQCISMLPPTPLHLLYLQSVNIVWFTDSAFHCIPIYLITHTYMFTYLCIHVQIDIYIYMYICMHACKFKGQHSRCMLYLCKGFKSHIHTYIHACMHTCIHAYMHTYMHIYIYIHTYILTHIHPSIHVYIHALQVIG